MVCSASDTEGVKAGWKCLEVLVAVAIEKGGGDVEAVRAELNRGMMTKVGDAMNKASAQNEGAL
jgi:hypothetical protein